MFWAKKTANVNLDAEVVVVVDDVVVAKDKGDGLDQHIAGLAL